METLGGRVPVLYLAPWVDVGGSDKGTIDWFRFLDRGRFAPSLITTQPSPNRLLAEVERYAEEVWDLPQLMPGNDFPRFICAFIESREIRLVHIMNSRLAFELLPAMATLPHPPRLVVQLHVEEPDRSGYVRYVTSRYGNLVDAFAVSTQALSDRLEDYDIPRFKRRVIPTGVDAQREFSPARVTPARRPDGSRLQIIFPARLTSQKDPLLMVEIGARLRSRGISFQLHVLGDGDLGQSVRERIAGLALENEILMHGESLEVARWYAACDLALLTSRFEGLPYVAYEAMAMGIPLVAPDLPGLEELVTPETGLLVSPRHDPAAYADAIASLASDPDARRRMGEAARTRVLSGFSLERMGDEYGKLYAELLAAGSERRDAVAIAERRPADPLTPRVALRSRHPGARPLVSVVVPCFNHGRYLSGCLESIAWQNYAQIETIVADDGSGDPDTLLALDRIEHERRASVVRLPSRTGPGAARNAAIARAAGRYVLPLDADNVLLPTAITDLVEQLGSAGEQIGFVYPNLQFFGNRQDYFEAPSFNLHALLVENYCDTGSLIDREVFDRGLRYSPDAGLIHEDWDFVLALAEHGIYGEPARTPTLLFRKRGFTRSDLVHSHTTAAEAVRARHPSLLRDVGRIKAEWNPSLTLIALDPVGEPAGEAIPNLLSATFRQSCSDFELIVRTTSELPPTWLGRRLRRVPAVLARSRAQALAHAIELARGAYVLAAYGSLAALLADRALVEKLLRVLQSDLSVNAVVLADAGDGKPNLRLLDAGEVSRANAGAVCWRVGDADDGQIAAPLPDDNPLETLALLLGLQSRVLWRHLRRPDLRSRGPSPPLRPGLARGGVEADLSKRRGRRLGDRRFRLHRAMLPACSAGAEAILHLTGHWIPPQSRLLCRHLHEPSQRYVYSHGTHPPHECSSSYVLGAVRVFPMPGTTSLSISAEGEPVRGATTAVDDPALLGFVELAALPLLDELSSGRHPRSGQRVLVGPPPDPLSEILEDRVRVGFVEAHPIHPRTLPLGVEPSYGMVGLVRAVDTVARRHRYGAGRFPAGIPAGELGALLSIPFGDCTPLWIDDRGRVFAAGHSLADGKPSLASAIRWVGAPLTWSNFGPLAPKLRATARRAYDSGRLIVSSAADPDRPAAPAGYLLRTSTSYTVPLYGAIHPVTGDQLLSTSPAEPTLLGYRDSILLGHLIGRAPVTGRLGPIRVGVSWASRFGTPVAST